MHNAKAFAMIEGRFSAHVKSFNAYDVSGKDSEAHYWLVRERLDLARAALERAPELKVTTLARSLGDVYRTVRQNLTPEELNAWIVKNEQLEALTGKYERTT